MEEGNILDKLKEMLGDFDDSLNILEEKIDVDLQVAFFDYLKKLKKDLQDSSDEAEDDLDPFQADNPEEQKDCIARLAIGASVENYRMLQKFVKEGDEELHDWAVLAMQQARMNLESDLLEENKVFISTGMGGKGGKLRYFIALKQKDDEDFSTAQQKVIQSEFDFVLQQHKSEIESISFKGVYAFLIVLMPLSTQLKETIEEAIQECNHYGNFLLDKFLITNVKELPVEEVADFFNKKDKDDQDEEDQSGPAGFTEE